jgi:hypothetical protein
MQIVKWTAEQIETATRMRQEGKSFGEIGKAIRREGETPSADANRSRGLRIVAFIEANAKSSETHVHPAQRTRKPEETKPTTKPTPSFSKPIEERTETGDTLSISLPKTRIKTLEQLIEQCEVDTRLWEVERFTCNKWEMGYLNAAKESGVQDLYQVKATFRAKRAEYNAQLALAAVLESVRSHAPVYPMIQRRGIDRGDGLMLELCLPDVHVGKLAWGAECGEDYDLKIAAAVFRDAFAALVHDAKSRPIERILFPVGNDLMNCDSPGGMTTAGTIQSNDGRYQKAYQVTLDLLVETIDTLRELAPVEVISVPGNHDTLSAWTITETLKAWYRRVGDVVVDNSPTLRKYRTWGRCLLGFTHGDKERPDDLPLLMATEQPQLWSATRYREWHLGHLHKSATKIKTTGDEYHGVRVRTLPSLCASDVWHSQMGYTGNIRSAESYYWHQERGLAGTCVYNVPGMK